MLKEGLNAEVVKSRAEEYGRELTVSDSVEVEVRTSAVDELNLLYELLTKIRSDKLVELLGVGNLTLYAVDKLTASVRIVEGENLSCLSVVHALESLTAADGPVHRIGIDAELSLELVKKVEGVSRLTVHLVDEGEDRNISHSADLEELSGLGLDTLCRVDNHYRAIRRHKGTVGILGEVLVTGGVENVDTVAVVLKLHNGGGDRDTSLLLDIHPVGYRVLVRLLALYRARRLNCATVEEELLGKGGFTRVGVRNDGEGTPSLDL